ncbi:hypothetical protein TRIUR3_28465 [Triticum urartu]|uniref:Carotenoid cleavage dioxygenase 8-like protein B, chloroplastic n=1 Tax=Triticum urartu TaxID=4572 RepID=M7ZUC6_TRIUA|nr:hypothetical protein TRIUR3_28465 [Triticum urartu]
MASLSHDDSFVASCNLFLTKLALFPANSRQSLKPSCPSLHSPSDELTVALDCDGTYLRNGPGLWDLGDYGFRHLFDGYATLVRVSFRDGRAVGAHRQIESEAYKAARRHGKLQVLRRPAGEPLPGNPLTDNSNTGVVRLGDGRVLCLTETVKGSIVVDPDTLDTDGRREQREAVRGQDAGSTERQFVGRVDCRGGPAPGWVHSFPVTENYVVVPEMPLRYCAANLLRAEPTPLYKFQWHLESGSYMHVMCKASGKIVASVEVPPFVTFHFINAYEEKDEEGRVTAIIADCCEHNADTSILDNLRLHNLRAFTGEDVLTDARVGRFRIPLDGSPFGELEAALDPEEHGRGMDMCSINPAHLGKEYRYAYACGARRPCNFPNTLTKIDLVEKTAKNWHEEGAVPSEPYFVARPGAVEEDDGVAISMVSAKDGSGYALVLDAKSFKEIARAKFPYGLPYGLHCCWVPRDK